MTTQETLAITMAAIILPTLVANDIPKIFRFNKINTAGIYCTTFCCLIFLCLLQVIMPKAVLAENEKMMEDRSTDLGIC